MSIGKPMKGSEELIQWRFQQMLRMAKELNEKSDYAERASRNEYIRIGGEAYRAVSLADDSPLCGFSSTKPKQVETVIKQFSENKPEPITGNKEERRLQNWLIREALRNKRSLAEPLGLKDAGHFDELLFCLDEVSIGDSNFPEIIRCDVLAVGKRGSHFFPVLIELKYNRSLDRLIEQLDGFVAKVKTNDTFLEIMTVTAGIPVDVKLKGEEFEKILVWPKVKTSPRKDTLEKLKKHQITQVEYNAHDNVVYDDISTWRFSVPKY